MRKVTVEGCRRIDVRRTHVHLGVGAVPLLNGQVVLLDWTQCHFGGRRPWYLCPRCGRRVAVLYDAGAGGFFCRYCNDLAYQTQRESWLGRMALKAQRLRHRLGAPGGLLEEFPTKPKGMHRRTYVRLRARGEHAEQIVLGAVEESLGALEERQRQSEARLARLEAECGNDEARWARALRTRSRRRL